MAARGMDALPDVPDAEEPRAAPRGRPLVSVSSRERRTVVVGGAVAAIALALTYGVAPFAQRWAEREALLGAKVERLSRLRSLVRDERLLAQAVRARETALAARGQRLLSARSPALAASALQSLVQEYGVASRVQVSRIDVATAGDSTTAVANGALPAIPATVAAVGDVYGLADLLARLERGPRLLEITDLAVQSTRGGRGEPLLQLSITLRAPYAPLEAP